MAAERGGGERHRASFLAYTYSVTAPTKVPPAAAGGGG